jgi:cell division septation protein DedD
MAQTEGEKELVLGNKQLISLFFVVVALCGVFFALGYMMGRPAVKSVAAIPETSASSVVSSAPQSQESEPPRETEQAAAPVGQTVAQPLPADTQVSSAPAPATPGDSQTQTRPARDIPSAAADSAETGASYLQVTALRRADADNLVKTLREQHLPALLADSSKPDLFRVLVGPYHQTSDVADAKARLKALGFANAFVQK